MKTPEEIKKGLEVCIRELDDEHEECEGCPYYIENNILCGIVNMQKDTLAYIEQLEGALNRMGEFGKLFMDYEGCPRGAMGRAAMPIEEEVLAMKPITDVDGGRWVPVNADALHELVEKYKQMEEAIPLMKIQMHGDCGCCKHRSGCRINGRDITMSKTCYDCMQKETRPNWEYEGLPEVKSK